MSLYNCNACGGAAHGSRPCNPRDTEIATLRSALEAARQRGEDCDKWRGEAEIWRRDAATLRSDLAAARGAFSFAWQEGLTLAENIHRTFANMGEIGLARIVAERERDEALRALAACRESMAEWVHCLGIELDVPDEPGARKLEAFLAAIAALNESAESSDELRRTLAEARAAIEQEPHAPDCRRQIRYLLTKSTEAPCTCWKSRALSKGEDR